MVILALVPYLALSGALGPITPFIAKDLHLSAQAMSLTSGFANAGYAVGTVLAVQFAQHLPQRRMLLLYATLLVIGSVLAAAASAPGVFIAGHVLQGLCTSLLLIAAVPPLVIGYGVEKLRWTAMILNMCIFGAVALGPVIGGIQAQSHGWRPLFWVIAGIAVGALLLAILTFEDSPPADRTAPRDPTVIALAAGGCALAFFGASELLTHPFVDTSTLLPLLVGLALIVFLLVHEYTSKRPLLCLRSLNSTLPVSGITAAICAAAASVSAITLISVLLTGKLTPLHLGLLQLPEFAGAVVTAIGLGLVFSTRFLHYYVLTGLLFLAAGAVVLVAQIPPAEEATAVGSGLVGFGVGASVAPALFIAGFSLRSSNIQRVFAIIELLRAIAAFMIAPVLLHFAMTVGGNENTGTRIALWICFGLALGGALLGVSLYALGGIRRPPAPSLERWTSGEAPGWASPPLFAAIRKRATEPALVQAVADASTDHDGSQAAPPSAQPVSEPPAGRRRPH
jgi:MFS family permease